MVPAHISICWKQKKIIKIAMLSGEINAVQKVHIKGMQKW